MNHRLPRAFDRDALTARAIRTAAMHAAAVTAAAVLIAALGSGELAVHGPAIVRAALDKQAVAPANAELITKGLATIQGNWYWFLLVTFPIAFAVLIGAVGLGVRSASDWMFRLVMAMVGVIAFAPAIVA